MSLQTSLTSRRQFLQRSAWGFGSAFILPSLLQSCMQDHNLPGPDSPIVFPPLLDDTADTWNNDARFAVLTGLQLIPDMGGFVSNLVSVLWPSEGDSPWDQVKAQVQALIDQSNQTLVLSQQQADLDGLQSLLSAYLTALSAVDLTTVTEATWPIDPQSDLGKALAYVLTEWNKLDAAFTAALPHFQLSGYEAVLLPLFAQFANLYLAFYRDSLTWARGSDGQRILVPFPITNGLVWGMTDTQFFYARDTLKKAIADFSPYVTKWYTSYLSNLQSKQVDTINNEPFKTANAYSRQMTMTVLDFMDTWQYYDLTQYPNGAINSALEPIPLFTREIYSDPAGNTYAGNYGPKPIQLPGQATQLPTVIVVYGGHQIDAVSLSYPPGGGPNGLTNTPRMGDQGGGALQGVLQLTVNNPITKAAVTYDWEDNVNNNTHLFQGIDTMYFVYHDGSHTSTYGKNAGSMSTGEIGYDGYALSSISIQGPVWIYNNTANCIVFGFLPWTSPSDSLKAVAKTYITNPREYSAAELVKAFPKLGLSANSISDELKVARKTYWDKVKARVK